MRLLALLLLLSLTAGTVASAQPAPEASAPAASLRVLSFNVRLHTASDRADAWPHRRDTVAAVLADRANLAGLQEAQRGMLSELEECLPGFAWFGEPRDDGSATDEYCAVLYRTDRLELLEHGTFRLSETPGERASVGWHVALPRIAAWGRFRDRTTGVPFLFLNTHFDHRGATARDHDGGDFNAVPAGAPYHQLTVACDAPGPPLTDAFVTAETGHEGPASTWNGFKAVQPGRRIDSVFVRGSVPVMHHRIPDSTFDGGRFPSDHLPVQAVVHLEAGPQESTGNGARPRKTAEPSSSARRMSSRTYGRRPTHSRANHPPSRRATSTGRWS